QQQGYGKAESLLEGKWPEKYNAAGHLSWAGRLYGKGLPQAIGLRRGKIYQGTWGNAPFQSVDEPTAGLIQSLPLMPEWYLVVGALAALYALGTTLWSPMLLVLPLLVLSIGAPIVQSVLGGMGASFLNPPDSPIGRFNLRLLTALLHLIQPLARLRGRLRHGLSPWRRRGLKGLSLRLRQTIVIWSERWADISQRLQSIEAALRSDSAVVLRGGHYDRWDLEVRGGTLGRARLCTVLEEHGAGKQLFRVRSSPRFSLLSLSLILLFVGLAVLAFHDHSLGAGVILGAIALAVILRTFYECAAATASVLHALQQVEEDEPETILNDSNDRVTHSAVSPKVIQPELAASMIVRRELEGTRD
ncbi:MAG: glycosyltransferase, partial [Pyrinomonadaceae bacterium]